MDFSSNVASQLHAATILPEGILIITLMSVLICDLIFGRKASSWLPYLAMAGLLNTLIALYFQWDNPNAIAFLGSFNGDNLSIAFRGIVALSAMVTIPMSIRYIQQSGTSLAEFIAIMLTAALGGMFLCGAKRANHGVYLP